MTGPLIDTRALRALARAAMPGPWHTEYVESDRWWQIYAQPHDGIVCPEVAAIDTDGADEALYIAAANPAVILALLDEVDQLRARIPIDLGDQTCPACHSEHPGQPCPQPTLIEE